MQEGTLKKITKMSLPLNLENKKFGRLSVGFRAMNNHKGRTMWFCICECGKYKVVDGYSLISKNTTSCGCYSAELTSALNAKDLVGKKINRLLVLYKNGVNSCRKVSWMCQCDCGGLKIVPTGDLLSGNTKSCGCYKKENSILSNIGNKSHFWQGGITDKNKLIRGSSLYSDWRKLVFKRDDFTCQICKKRGNKINAHHIENYSNNYQKRFDENNGITLCQKCHNEFHKIYGIQNNDVIQLMEFINPVIKIAS